MARLGRRMPPHELGIVDRMNLVLHSEGMEASEGIFTIPAVRDEFGIEIHGPKVFHIRIQALHTFSVTKSATFEPLRKTLESLLHLGS